jgi:hypothetical protein
MNSKFQKINIEDVLFFDAEVVRKNKELEIDSLEYQLYQKKTRNRETDEFLTDEELQEDYKKRAALKIGYNKIVTIGVGFVKNNTPYIKSIEGTEEEVIKIFCELTQQFKYVCGANILAYDLPMIINNGWKYFNVVQVLPDQFLTSGKKQWNLDMVIDLMETFKGTHYYNSSVEEICYHFDIPTPKDDISGAEVSETYYNEGIGRISTYVKKDVLANINIFLKMQGKDIYTEFVDRSDIQIVDERTVLEKLYATNQLTDNLKKDIEKLTQKKKLTATDKKNLVKILLSVYQTKGDKVAVKKEKQTEVEEFIKTL